VIQLIQNKAMILNSENIEAVIKNPAAFRGYTFILSGESICRRGGIPKYYSLVGRLFKVWGHCDWEFRIIAPGGLDSIDRNLGAFVNEVV